MNTDGDHHLDIDFTVPCTHRLRFTENVWEKDQQVLADLLQPSGDTPARVQFWADAQLLQAHPELSARIRRFGQTYADRINVMGRVQEVPGGEEIKNDIHILERMLKVMHAAQLDRRSYVVVIGGGAVLDAVGFAAAIAHRGIRLVRLPTTTLSQADSGVGVKNSVNLFNKKNWIGTFAVPWGVVNDAAMLESLSQRDFIGGFSEAVKVSLLKDPEFFEEICAKATAVRDRQVEAYAPIIRQSAKWHINHITAGGDPFEAEEARPLDFGHWSAHRLEVMSNFAVRHGEAVAIGVAIDSVYSALAHKLPAADARRIVDCLRALGFSLTAPDLADVDALFAGMEEFRQHLGGRLTLTMLDGVGQPIDVHSVDRDKMRAAIAYVAQLSKAPAERTTQVVL